MTLRIGFEVPSGKPVEVELQHTAVYGLTRQSGKTTLLEGLASRVEDRPVLVFRTGRNELGFEGGTPIPPYFRERYDWRYVEGLLWSFLNERPKIYRTQVMKATQGATSLRDVHRRIVAAGKDARSGFDRDLLYQLDHYFQEILPGLEDLHLSTGLHLPRRGVVVMDLEKALQSVQQLVIGATLDRLMVDPGFGAIVVLPEARDFIPDDRTTPAKLSADQFVRRGAKLGLFLWLDSQSLTGVDQQVLRNFGLSLHGRQTSDLEVKRIVRAVGHGVKAEDVKGLELGQFLLEDRESVRKVYAQPAWLHEDVAREVATGGLEAKDVRPAPAKVKNVDAKQEQAYKDKIAELSAAANRQMDYSRGLEEKLKVLEQQLRERGPTIYDRPPRPTRVEVERAVADAVERANPDGSLPELVFPDRAGNGSAVEVRADVSDNRLVVQRTVTTVEAGLDSSLSRVAFLITEGFFDTQKLNSHVRDEMRSRGWGSFIGGGGQDAMTEVLGQLTTYGFLTKVEGNKKTYFQIAPDAKARIRVVETPETVR